MSAQTIPPLRIAVVGGGIAGLTAALSLVKSHRDGANIKIDVYETASKFAEIGAGVAFGPNAQRALRMLDCEEVLTKNAAGADSDPDTWFYMTTGQKDHPRCGEVVRAIQGHNAAKGSVHRADFLDGLIDRLPKELAHFNHRCVAYEPHSEGITLTFTSQDGKTITAEADVVIASDGIKSLIRKHLYTRKNLDVSSQTAVYAEWIAWRGMIPVEKFKQVFGDKMDTKMMFFGLDKHILTFPVRQGKFVNIVGFVRDPEHKKLGDHTGPWSEPRPAEEMLEDYSTFSDECVNMLREIENPSIWGIFELKELSCTTDERLVLIGDSAHAMTPHQGSGAGQAIEDALFITSLLTSPKVANAPISSRPSQIQKAINIYASVRHARGAQVAKTSREAGLLYEFRSVTGEGDDMEKITQNIQHRMQWIWNWDTEGELKKALESLD